MVNLMDPGRAADVGGARVTLRDDRQVLIRAIRPEDGVALAAAFRKLSARSKQLRFGSAPRILGTSALRHLVDSVDGVNHVAFVAFETGDQGRLIGVARILRYPGDPDTLDVGMAVADDYQGAGLGHVLGHLLAVHRPRPAKRIVTQIAIGNDGPMRLLQALGGTPTRSGTRVVVELVDGHVGPPAH